MINLVMMLLQNQAAAPEMTIGGWIFIICAWAGILSLVVFCFSRVLGKSKR